jgi:TPR repeat protein
MSNLGLLLHQRGDEAAAERWWRCAADQGNTGAMSNLGVLLVQTRGDEGEAERWWRCAADRGNTGAMSNLGLLLDKRGGDANLAEAELLLQHARRHGMGGPQ